MAAWIFLAAYIAVAFMAFAQNVEGAQNVVVAYIWFSVVIYSVVLFCAKECAMALASKPRQPVLRFFSTVTSVSVAGALAWRGEFMLCGMICFCVVISAGIYDKAEKIRKGE